MICLGKESRLSRVLARRRLEIVKVIVIPRRYSVYHIAIHSSYDCTTYELFYHHVLD